MADENTNENPLDTIRARADEMKLEGDERDDYILGRMQRAGFKKGPGEWIKPEDDDSPQDDDDEPVTRGEWRRIQRERRQAAVKNTPPKKVTSTRDDKRNGDEKSKDPWW